MQVKWTKQTVSALRCAKRREQIFINLAAFVSRDFRYY